MALPDPGTVSFDQVNAANTTQTDALTQYQNAMAEYDQAALNLQAAQAAFDEAQSNAQAALDSYDLAAKNYDNERQEVGGSPLDQINLPAARARVTRR